MKLIKLKGFDNYHFCPRKCEVFSEKNGIYSPISPIKKYRKDKTYILYQNGVYQIVKFIDLLISNWQEIELSLKEKAGNLFKFP